MAIERTLSIIKPDAVAKNVIGQIYARFEGAGLKVVAARMAHLSRGEAEACSLRIFSGCTTAAAASLSRSDLARSVMRAKSLSPFWWIQRNSCTARKRFSPCSPHQATSASRSRSSRLTRLTAGLSTKPRQRL